MLGDGLDKPISPQMTWIGWSHNPEVAGSNPAPATTKGPAKRGLLFPVMTAGHEICTRFCTTSLFKGLIFAVLTRARALPAQTPSAARGRRQLKLSPSA